MTMEISLNLIKSEILAHASRDVAVRVQLLAEKASDFELLTITPDDQTWVNERIANAAKQLYPDLHPYATAAVYEGLNVQFTLTLVENFNAIQEHTLKAAIFEIISKKVVAEWFQEKAQADLHKELLKEVGGYVEQVKGILFQWQVSRTLTAPLVEEAIPVLENDRNYNFLVIGIPHAVILTQVMEDVNATLKARLPGTTEYEKYKISDVHTPVLRRSTRRGVSTIADRSQAYAIMWKDDAVKQDVHEVISQLKGIDNTNTDIEPYHMIVFRMPENFNRQSIRNISESIKSSLVSKSMGQYFVEVGLTEISQFYLLQEQNDLKDIMSLLHRRTKPLRRKGNFFN